MSGRPGGAVELQTAEEETSVSQSYSSVSVNFTTTSL